MGTVGSAVVVEGTAVVNLGFVEVFLLLLLVAFSSFLAGGAAWCIGHLSHRDAEEQK